MTPSQPLASSQTTHRKNRPVFLLVILFLLLLVGPAFEGRAFAALVLSSFFTLLLLSAALAVSRQRWLVVTIGCMGVPWVVLSWLGGSLELGVHLKVLQMSLQAVFAGFLVVLWMHSVLTSRTVSANTLCRAVSVYLLIGLAWASMYAIVSLLDSAAISSSTEQALTWNHCVYFSFVTLTTLGYGDVTPVSPYARSLVMVEAVIGPMYLAILIARLVGLYTRAQSPQQ